MPPLLTVLLFVIAFIVMWVLYVSMLRHGKVKSSGRPVRETLLIATLVGLFTIVPANVGAVAFKDTFAGIITGVVSFFIIGGISYWWVVRRF
jgi:hypothetical protein